MMRSVEISDPVKAGDDSESEWSAMPAIKGNSKCWKQEMPSRKSAASNIPKSLLSPLKAFQHLLSPIQRESVEKRVSTRLSANPRLKYGYKRHTSIRQ